MKPSELCARNPKLNMVFVAQLFEACPALPSEADDIGSDDGECVETRSDGATTTAFGGTTANVSPISVDTTVSPSLSAAKAAEEEAARHKLAAVEAARAKAAALEAARINEAAVRANRLHDRAEEAARHAAYVTEASRKRAASREAARTFASIAAADRLKAAADEAARHTAATHEIALKKKQEEQARDKAQQCNFTSPLSISHIIDATTSFITSRKALYLALFILLLSLLRLTSKLYSSSYTSYTDMPEQHNFKNTGSVRGVNVSTKKPFISISFTIPHQLDEYISVRSIHSLQVKRRGGLPMKLNIKMI